MKKYEDALLENVKMDPADPMFLVLRNMASGIDDAVEARIEAAERLAERMGRYVANLKEGYVPSSIDGIQGAAEMAIEHARFVSAIASFRSVLRAAVGRELAIVVFDAVVG